MRFIFLIIFTFLVSKIHAQETIELNVNKTQYLENLGNVTPPILEGVIPTINGELNVNSQGALTYMVPIEAFKGVNEFQPNIALGYSSDGGNGQAGYGWNIIGLSSITRGGKTKEIDGVYEGVQFDGNDPYYLDGQRLIGFDDNSPNEAVTEIYSTIKITKLANDGNYKFLVQYPDGKYAKYKEIAPDQYYIGLYVDGFDNEIEYFYELESNTAYLTMVKYGKTSGQHPFTISFSRENKNQPVKAYRNGVTYVNSKILKSISVSSTEGLYRKYTLTHDISSLGLERLRFVDVENASTDKLKTLKFNYSDEGNYTIENTVSANTGLTENTKELGSVTMGDFEGTGEISSVYTIYDDSDSNNNLVSSKLGLISAENINFFKTELFSGKIINSEGKITLRDQLITVKTINNGNIFINGLYYTNQRIEINFRDLVNEEVNTLSFDLPIGYVGERTGNCPYIPQDYLLRVIRNPDPRKFLVGDFNSDGLIDVIIYQNQQMGSIMESPYGQTYCENDGLINDYELLPEKVYFIEIGKTVSTDNSITNLIPYEYQINDFKNLEHYIVEYNGDGIPEILQLNENTGRFDIIKINHKEKSFDTLLTQYQLHNYEIKTPLIFGDFNGDGLTDFITPKKIFELSQDNNVADLIPQLNSSELIWNQYISTGISYQHAVRDFTEQKLAYCAPSSRYYIRESGSLWKKLWSGPTYEYDYSQYGACTVIPIDFNNDGKTDLASFRKFGKANFDRDISLNDINIQNVNAVQIIHQELDSDCYNQCIADCTNHGDASSGEYGSCVVTCLEDCSEQTIVEEYDITNNIIFHENIYDTTKDFNFVVHEESSVNVGNILISPFSFFINSQSQTGLNQFTTELKLHDPQQSKDIIFKIHSNEFFEHRIEEIDNGSGVVQTVEYTPMESSYSNGENDTNCSYLYNPEILDLPYPYFVHKQAPLKFMVSKINTLFDDKSISKQYRYQNAVQHLDGKGFLGFTKTFVSDPFESQYVETENTYVPKNSQNPVFWNINSFDPELENQLVETRYGELSGTYFTKSVKSYEKFTKNNHRYLYHVSQEVNHDRIKNITVTNSYTYDEPGDLLLLTSSTDYNGQGTSVTNIGYQPSWLDGTHFYHGRINYNEQITNAYNNSFTTRDEYSAFGTGGLPLTHLKYGNNTPAITTETTYDGFGNKTSTTVSALGVTALTTSYAYDDSKRYITSVTDPEGLTSVSEVDIYGKALSETSALDNFSTEELVTTHTYDNWGNPATSTDALGNVTTLIKSASTNGNYSLYTSTPGSPKTIVTFDKFDREIQVKTQSINNKWVVVDTEYDVFGKKTRVSEPYFSTDNPTLWNSFEYDELDRPIKQTMYNGKIITTCHDGMTITVDDGEQKTSKVLDVFGNVIIHKDAGGEITYNYYPNGTLKSANYGGIIIEVEQDGWGNKTKLIDPSAGVYEYEYDSFGRKTLEKTPKGQTVYQYDDFGKLISETTTGDETDLFLEYLYDANTKLPTQINGYNGNDNFSYSTDYDSYFRINGKTETTPFFTYTTNITFDENYGRPEFVTTQTYLPQNGETVNTSVKNEYDNNGLQTRLRNQLTNELLWEIDAVNARGQLQEMLYGNGYQITQGYDDYYLPQNISHSKGSETALSIDYTFDAQKFLLLSRNNHVINKNENYEYDDLHRLTKELLNGNVLNEYGYDKRGRLTYNSEIGKYHYPLDNYQIEKIGFNQNGLDVRDNRGFHTIVYNNFKQAVSIHLPGKERINFDYNPFKERVVMYYGSEDEDKALRPLRKYYTSDKAVEIKHNLQTGDIEVLTYLDGDPYTANVLQRNYFGSNQAEEQELWYLHRDYQSTILAITNQDGDILEQRYFDAWGSLKEYKDETGTLMIVTDATQINLILDRGYTGHEHLWGVDLVHMNGRLYDAKLRRFLSPDNFVQDPYNTQNFNRYGYVLNNPLLYTDPSGEFIQIGVWGAIAIGAALGLTTKAIINIATGQTWWYGIGKATVMGAVSGAISFGIGEAAIAATQSFLGQSALQAGMHGLSGGFMSVFDGGEFGSGFLSGMVSSVIASGVKVYGEIASMFEFYGSSGISDNTIMAIQIASGGLSGGISSTIAGGNFWSGVKQGLITSGLNHAMHGVVKDLQKRKWNKYMESELDRNGYEPYGPSTLNKDYAEGMIRKIPILSAVKQRGLNKGRIAGFEDLSDAGGSSHGRTNTENGNIYLSNTSTFVKTNFGMALTIYHEMLHIVYRWNPSVVPPLMYSGQKRKDYEHFLIHREVWTHLESSQPYGVNYNDLKNISNRYGWRL
ncbi:MAG: RHS repeat-associated core domain-containing protein [Flavobacteriaceae bacterium]|nr:RHS repeat-associated core domain-containing protein [Flavobacteriaceae bacterium]